MRVFLDMEEISSLAVQDHKGVLHRKECPAAVRPFPFCAQCGTEVDGFEVARVLPRDALVFTVRCHGEMDVVRFLLEQDLTLIALPCFQTSAEERNKLIEWLAAGAPADVEFNLLGGGTQ